MTTLKADDRRRVQLPDIKPGQVFALETPGEGQFVLTVLKKADIKEPFPPGRLRKHVDAMNREWAGVKPFVPEPEGLD